MLHSLIWVYEHSFIATWVMAVVALIYWFDCHVEAHWSAVNASAQNDHCLVHVQLPDVDTPSTVPPGVIRYSQTHMQPKPLRLDSHTHTHTCDNSPIEYLWELGPPPILSDNPQIYLAQQRGSTQLPARWYLRCCKLRVQSRAVHGPAGLKQWEGRGVVWQSQKTQLRT